MTEIRGTDRRGRLLAGRYKIGELIGRGGMGEVHAAWDELGRVRVCAKFIRRDLSTPELVARLRVEYRASTYLIHHNLVRVMDLVDDDVDPALILEFVPGPDLQFLVDRTPDHGLSHGAVVELGVQLARGLAFLHDQGPVLHRDIKPANVFVTRPDAGRRDRWSLVDLEPAMGQPAPYHALLADFGLVRGMAPDASDLTGDRPPPGTPAYMAPEVRSGEEASVQSDLYSLGLTLLRVLRGGAAMPGPADVREEEGALGEVLARLLEHRPEDRFENARGLLAALEGARASMPVPPDTAGLRPFVGRAHQLDALLDACRSTIAGHPRLVLVEGGHGSGRSTLLRLSGRETPVLLGYCERLPLHPLAPLGRLARSLLGRVRAQGAERRLLGDEGTILEALAETDRGAALESPDGALAGFATVLDRLFEEGPVALAFDDLDRASPELLEACHWLLRSLAHRGLAVAGAVTAIDGGVGRLAGVAEHDGIELRKLRCGPLLPDDVTLWIRMSVPGVSREAIAAVAERLVSETGGMPGALADRLDQLHEAGLMRAGEDGRLAALVSERWPARASTGRPWPEQSASLSRDSRTVLSLICAEPAGFSVAELSAIAELDMARTEEACGVLEAAALCSCRPSIREDRYIASRGVDGPASLDDDLRLRIARVLSGRRDADGLVSAAGHLESVGRAQGAAVLLSRAARLLDARWPRRARFLREQAVEGLPGRLRVATLLRMGDAAQRHRPAEARAFFEEAAEEATRCAPGAGRRLFEALGHYGVGRCNVLLGQSADEEIGFLEASAAVRLHGVAKAFQCVRNGSPREALECLDGCGSSGDGRLSRLDLDWARCRVEALWRATEYQEAEAMAASMRERCRNAGDRVSEVAFAQWVGIARSSRGDTDGALRSVRELLSVTRDLGLHQTGYSVALNAARQESAAGRHREAMRLLRRALRSARQTGIKGYAARALVEQGLVCLELGQWQRSDTLFSEALAIYPQRDRVPRAIALQYLAQARLGKGDMDSARAACDASLEILGEESGDRLAVGVELIRAQVDIEDSAIDCARDRLERLGRDGRLRSYRELRLAVIRSRVELSLADGRPERALRRLRALEYFAVGEENASLLPWLKHNSGNALADLGRLADAVGELRTALGLAGSRENRVEESRVLADLARVYEAVADPESVALAERCRAAVEQARLELESIATDVLGS